MIKCETKIIIGTQNAVGTLASKTASHEKFPNEFQFQLSSHPKPFVTQPDSISLTAAVKLSISVQGAIC